MATSVPPEIATALSRHVHGWENSLNVAWHPLAAKWAEGLSPVGTCSQNGERIFPQLDATGHHHVFKAFESVSPAEVRVVLLGQDPYPNELQATGRAFEQGDLESFGARKPPVAYSLNKMLRRMVEAVVKDEAKVKGVALHKVLARSPLEVASPAQVFDHLAAQGGLVPERQSDDSEIRIAKEQCLPARLPGVLEAVHPSRAPRPSGAEWFRPGVPTDGETCRGVV